MSQALSLPLPFAKSKWSTCAELANRRSFQLGTLLFWAFFFNREGFSVPNGNEVVYLLYFYKAWHHHFLSTDWTFQETTAGHTIFNYAIGWLTLLMPLKSAAWVGRVLCWIGSFIGLLRVGSHFKIPGWAVWLGILLWLIVGQAPVTMEWIIGSFEAKCIAYICLLFAIDAALNRKNLLAGILTGIAFSFHSAVGMWGGAALGFAVLFFNPIKQIILFSTATLVIALPGLITSLPLLLGKHAITPEEAKYLVTVCEPACLDPLIFRHFWLLVMLLLLAFAWLHARWLRNDRSVQMLFCFELATAIFFLLGVIFRLAQRFDLAQLFPLRVFAVFVLLLFYWQLLGVLINFFSARGKTNEELPPISLLCFGLFLFLCLPSPVLKVRDLISERANRYLDKVDEHPSAKRFENVGFRDAEIWIAQNTPEQDVVIAPPWRTEAFYFMQRPLIADWRAPRYDALTEWKTRIEALVGKVTPNPKAPGELGTDLQQHYAHLSETQILDLKERYNAKWLVTSGQYSFEKVFESHTYVIYRIP